MLKKILSLLVILMAIAGFFGLMHASKYWAFQIIEKALKTEVRGEFKPHPFFFEFQFNNASFKVLNRGEVSQADITVTYQVADIFPKPSLRIQVVSTKGHFKVHDSLLDRSVIREDQLKWFYADLKVDDSGIKSIYELEIKSPSYNIQLKPGS